MITVTVNGINRNAFINWELLQVNQATNSQPDTASFIVKLGGNKNWTPQNGDNVIIDDNGTDIFGGRIVRVNAKTHTIDSIEYEVICVSWEIDLDRLLIADTFEDKTLFFILNTIIAEYVNPDTSILYVGQSLTDEAGTSVQDTTNNVIGIEAQRFAVTTNVAGRFEVSKNLNFYDNLVPSTGNDQLTGWVFVTGNIDTFRVRIGNETGGTYTNYLEQSYNVQQGYNYLVIDLADMTEVGTFDPTAVEAIQFYAEGEGSVTIDDWRVISAESFTQKNIKGASTIISYAQFNYEQGSKVFMTLAERVGFDWYIDPQRDIHFFEPTTETAPFELSDTNGNYIFNSLMIEKDRSTLKNEIIVRGGQEVGNQQTEDLTYQVDGTNTIFQMGYGYQGIVIELNSVQQSVGVDFINDFTEGFDVLYNFQEKSIRFETAPSASTPLTVTGRPFIPVIVKKRDASSIAENGVVQYLIVDRSINSRQGARDRAQAELNAYRKDLQEGEFRTYQSGLRAGQEIHIQSDIRNIDETFIVSRLRLEMHTPEEPIYEATIVSTRTYGMIEFLIDLLRRENRQIVINPDEVIDIVETYDETISLDEIVTIEAPINFDEDITMTDDILTYIDDPPTWVAGRYEPTSLADRKRTAYTDRSNLLAY